jgi:hypothetical protein
VRAGHVNSRLFSLAILLMLASPALRADEGLWPFTDPPVDRIKRTYGFEMTATWLQHLQESAVRFPDGSGSFVSGDGLVITNHHVGFDAIQKLSTPEHNYVVDGFRARFDAQNEIKRQAHDTIARARFALDGTAGYPNATFTLR